MSERREILARLSPLYLAIEGSLGTVHEGRVALDRDSVVVPVGRSGGYAGDLCPLVDCPAFAPNKTWSLLDSSGASAGVVAQAVYKIVCAITEAPANPSLHPKCYGWHRRSPHWCGLERLACPAHHFREEAPASVLAVTSVVKTAIGFDRGRPGFNGWSPARFQLFGIFRFDSAWCASYAALGRWIPCGGRRKAADGESAPI